MFITQPNLYFKIFCNISQEKAEKILVGNKMNWPEISFSFQTFYSKYSPYPDLFCYWNADSDGPIHPISGALSSNQEVRGSAIFVRAEPPKAQDVLAVSDNGNSSLSQVTSQDATQWTIELGVQELLDTFEFYKENSFRSVDNTRALKRMMPKMNFMYFNQ